MRKRDVSYNILISVLMLISLVALLLANLGDRASRIIDAALELGHLPLFGIVSIALLWIMNNRKWPVYNKKYYVLSFAFTVLLGAVTEFLQLFTAGRFFELSDLAHDALGAFTFLIISYPAPAGLKKKLLKYRLMSFVIIMFASLPLLLVVIDTWRMKRDMPILASFEGRLEMERLSARYQSLNRSRLHATHGVYSLETHFAPGIYPGISMNYFFSDWVGYDCLSIDAFLEGTTKLPITIRINDTLHNHEYTDRFNRVYLLIPGANRITVDLDEVRKAPHARTMDMQHIDNICIFSYRLKESRVLYFDNLKLVKRKAGGIAN